MELKEFAETYFKEKDFKPTKHQQEIIDALSKWKNIILRTNRFAWRKTLNQMYAEFISKEKIK